ncbi:MAG TPA: zinc-binding alcohol dehydrogenase [Tepidisphaeraceae bacterium]|jgi:threonine dehydrogenase-like Zn-dependent dehydrogenase
MPKEVIGVTPGKLEWKNYEDKPLGPKEIRITPQFAAAKHGTEMAYFKGYFFDRGDFDGKAGCFGPPSKNTAPPPYSIGNMFVGTVTEIGKDVTKFKVGDRACSFGPFRPSSTSGEDWSWKMTKEMPWQNAVCLDPAEFAMGAVRDGQVRVGDAVAIFGLGAIGLMAVQLARLSGATTIIALDPLENRRAVATKLGATLTLDPTKCDAGLEIRKATGGRGADVAIEYSGSRPGLQAALRGIAFGGNVVCGAFPPPYDAGLDFGAEAHFNRPNIIFSRACSDPGRDHPRWDNNRIFATCWQLLSDGRLSGTDIVTPIVPFDNVLEEYPRVITNPASGIKLGVKF